MIHDICVYVYMCICMCVYKRINVYMCICVCVCIYIYIVTNKYCGFSCLCCFVSVGSFWSGWNVLRGAMEARGPSIAGCFSLQSLGVDLPITRPVWDSNPRPPASETNIRNQHPVDGHNHLHFSICACHPCAGAMLIISAPF